MSNKRIECPTCADFTRVEVNQKSDGFSAFMLECGHCGTVWTLKDGIEKAIILNSVVRNSDNTNPVRLSGQRINV
ncbi:MAG: hypothetical protein WA003_09580 [Desulfuromonadaceae bacterium]